MKLMALLLPAGAMLAGLFFALLSDGQRSREKIRQHEAEAAQAEAKLDACAREANVYQCEWVAQPVRSPILPPPAE